jgi:hypothetical protein
MLRVVGDQAAANPGAKLRLVGGDATSSEREDKS